VIVVRFTVRCRPERTAEVVAALSAAEGPSRALPGVAHFDVTRSLTEPNTLIVVEAFEDRAAMERQNAQAEAAVVTELIGSGALDGDPEWTVWEASVLDRSPAR
jgi:quinol monooxygenase YgiN